MLKQSYKKVLGFWTKQSYKLKQASLRLEDTEKVICLSLEENLYSRYLYAFIKFFVMEGYRVVLNASPETIYSIKEAQYGNLVLTEGLVSLTKVKAKNLPTVSIGGAEADKKLQPTDFVKSESEVSVYDVPMAQHPLMYAKGYWNAEIDHTKAPVQSILFIGNCGDELYSEISRQNLFTVMNRAQMRAALCKKHSFVDVENKMQLLNPDDGSVYFTDSYKVGVDLVNFRPLLAQYYFFLCAPGVFMPLCHNLVESLSVGVIPIIQRAYAEMLTPALEDGKNALIFDCEDALIQTVERALEMPKNLIREMRSNVIAYYENNMTPHAVVAHIMNPDVTSVRMLAGKHSLALLKQQKCLVS